MIGDLRDWYGPPARFLDGEAMRKGFTLNRMTRAVHDAKTGRIVSRIVVGDGLSQSLSDLPAHPTRARDAILASAQLAPWAGTLQALQVASTIGAIASVANVAVSVVGFALVLDRLSKIDGKLDICIDKLDALHTSVEQLHVQHNALSLARLRTASESLDGALAASTLAARAELAARSRNMFQESKALYRELWLHARPWTNAEIQLQTGLEMQGRFVACAIGEIQAAFVIGDAGAFKQTIRAAVTTLRTDMAIDAAVALRARNDSIAAKGPTEFFAFSVDLPITTALLQRAAYSTQWTANRLEAFAEDLDTAKAWGLEPHEFVSLMRGASGPEVYAVGPPARA